MNSNTVNRDETAAWEAYCKEMATYTHCVECGKQLAEPTEEEENAFCNHRCYHDWVYDDPAKW